MDDLGRLHPHHYEPPPLAGITGRTRTIALMVLCLCALTIGIDMTITNVALPAIGHQLDAPTHELQWVVDGYNIMIAGLLVLGGGLADRYGRRRVFIMGYTLFGLASLTAAFSAGSGGLIASRVVMGIGAAGVSAPALAIIAAMYPPEERGGAIGAFVVFGASGLAIGPIAGGLLLDQFWWGSVFLVNVPLVAIAVILAMRTVAESRAPLPDGEHPPLDVIGALFSVVGLSAVLFGVIEGPSRGWTSAPVVAGLAVGAIVIAFFIHRELRVRSPLFDVRILARPVVLTGSITLFMAYVLFTGFLFIHPQYLQDVESETIVTVGLLLVPFALVFGICSKLAPAALRRLGGRVTITLGLAGSAVSTALLAVATGGSLAFTVAASALLGAALSLLIAPPSTVVMNDLPESKAGDGSSLNMVSRFVGAAVGVAVVGSVLASIYASQLRGSLGSLNDVQGATAQGSIQGALEVAKTLSPSSSQALATAARPSRTL